MLGNGVASSVPIEHDEILTLKNVRMEAELHPDGIKEVSNGRLALDFKDVIGVKREGARVIYVAYPKVVGTATNCCVTGEEARQRTETVFTCSTEEVARKWETTSWGVLQRDFINRKGRHIRRFMVLLNPHSGKGLSEKIFNDHSLPMFRDAGIECTVIKTEYSGHASKLCNESNDLLEFDGIVIVSGDGLLFEVIQGLMSRPDWAKVVKTVALGVIPGGSGNGLAISLADASGEIKGPLSNSFLIAKGNIASMDLCAVDHFGKGRVYSFLSLEFGFVADIDIGSEWMRSLGEVRFTLEALLLLFSPKSTRCRLSYLPVAGSPLTPSIAPRVPSYWDSDGYDGSDGPKTTLTPPLSQRVGNDWVTIEDKFFFMWHCNVAHMSSSAHVSPHSKWDDGYLQLCFYRKTKSRMARLNLLRFLLALETGGHITDHGASIYPAIEMLPARAYRLEPLKKTGTRMAVDGELFELGPIQMEVLPGIMLLMGAAATE